MEELAAFDLIDMGSNVGMHSNTATIIMHDLLSFTLP
jgi:hypothetical protein